MALNLMWLLPVGIVLLLGTPVFSTLDIRFPPIQKLESYWLVTGIISASVGAIFLFRHFTEPGDSGTGNSTVVQHAGLKNPPHYKVDKMTEYPPVYITATRPTRINVKAMVRFSADIDSFVERIEKYTDSLETILADKTADLDKNRAQLDCLLRQLLPSSIASKFSAGERVLPSSFDCVTVYYCDIVGYTNIIAQSSAAEMIEFLNSLYRMTDSVIENYDAYKVETIGDADLIASGIPIPNGNKHASEVGKLALHMLRSFADFRLPHRLDESPQIRIGLHSGKCMAGIVNTKIPKYVLFGDAVIIATKLECTSEPGRIQISTATADLLRETNQFVVEPRGRINLKGRPQFETFWLEGLKN